MTALERIKEIESMENATLTFVDNMEDWAFQLKRERTFLLKAFKVMRDIAISANSGIGRYYDPTNLRNGVDVAFDFKME